MPEGIVKPDILLPGSLNARNRIEKKGYKEYKIKESTRDTHPKCIVIKSEYGDLNNFNPTFQIEQDLIDSGFLKLSLDILPEKHIKAVGSLEDSTINSGYNDILIEYFSTDILFRIYSPNFKKQDFSFQPFVGSASGQRKLIIK